MYLTYSMSSLGTYHTNILGPCCHSSLRINSSQEAKVLSLSLSCCHFVTSLTYTDKTVSVLFGLQWEAFSLPELESFLLILYKEEETYLQEIKQTYVVLKVQIQHRLKQLKQDRIGAGAKLKPVAT